MQARLDKNGSGSYNRWMFLRIIWRIYVEYLTLKKIVECAKNPYPSNELPCSKIQGGSKLEYGLKSYLSLIVFVISPLPVVSQSSTSVYTPSPGNSERKEILDTIRKNLIPSCIQK